jgi:hypothetical protein
MGWVGIYLAGTVDARSILRGVTIGHGVGIQGGTVCNRSVLPNIWASVIVFPHSSSWPVIEHVTVHDPRLPTTFAAPPPAVSACIGMRHDPANAPPAYDAMSNAFVNCGDGGAAADLGQCP